MPHESAPGELILASSSPYRSVLLERLGLPFECVPPGVEESQKAGEAPRDMVTRLAVEKALAVSGKNKGAYVLGSDQIAVHEGSVTGKPGNGEMARRQLTAFSGSVVEFLSSVALAQDGQVEGFSLVQTRVSFRSLSQEEIARYVERDQPFDCAGSFRAERLGPSLFESVFSQDPTAIIGLPLIETARLLREAGFRLP